MLQKLTINAIIINVNLDFVNSNLSVVCVKGDAEMYRSFI